jgi:hypothetical protein
MLLRLNENVATAKDHSHCIGKVLDFFISKLRVANNGNGNAVRHTPILLLVFENCWMLSFKSIQKRSHPQWEVS